MAAPLKEVETLISAIGDGDYDVHLGLIMKAVFNRHKQIRGGTRGAETPAATDEEMFAEPSIARRGTPPKKHRRIDDEPDDPKPQNTRKNLAGRATGPTRPAKVLDQSKKIPSYAVVKFGTALDKKTYFEYGNKYYRRSDVMGYEMKLPMTFKPTNLVGYRVRITGIGPQRLKVEFIDMPSQGMSYYEHARKGDPIWLPKGLLAPYLH